MKHLLRVFGTLILSAGMLSLPVMGSERGQRTGGGNHRTTTNANTHRGGATYNKNNPGKKNQGNVSAGRPGSSKPVNSGARPGNHGTVRPGNHGTRPGGNWNRPNGGHNHGFRPPVSAPRPGGYHGPVAMHRPWVRPLPPVPRRPRVVYSVNPIAPVLGLVYGSMINAGLVQLANSGYNVVSYTTNEIFLNNVAQFGFVWPLATVYYGTSGMNRARFQYFTPYQDYARYNAVYSTLCGLYGNPVDVVAGAAPSATWWGGGRTGYVTLNYAPGIDENGTWGYYTDVVYGN